MLLHINIRLYTVSTTINYSALVVVVQHYFMFIIAHQHTRAIQWDFHYTGGETHYTTRTWFKTQDTPLYKATFHWYSKWFSQQHISTTWNPMTDWTVEHHSSSIILFSHGSFESLRSAKKSNRSALPFAFPTNRRVRASSIFSNIALSFRNFIVYTLRREFPLQFSMTIE